MFLVLFISHDQTLISPSGYYMLIGPFKDHDAFVDMRTRYPCVRVNFNSLFAGLTGRETIES